MTSLESSGRRNSSSSNGEGRVDAGAAAVKLARLTRHLLADERDDDALTLALRLGIEQLFHRDTAERRQHLLFAADALQVLPRDRLIARAAGRDGHALVDLVAVACLVRAGQPHNASHILLNLRGRALDADLAAALADIERELDVLLAPASPHPSSTAPAASFAADGAAAVSGDGGDGDSETVG